MNHTREAILDGIQAEIDATPKYFESKVTRFEGSQVGLAHALALSPLGRRSLFAGDPKQLAPIVRSSDSSAIQWLGNSMFALQS